MRFHICAVVLCLVQDGQALRDANEKNSKSSLNVNDVNETKETSCGTGTQCSIMKKTPLPPDEKQEVDEEVNYTHQPRKRDIPNWSAKYDKDPHGHLHMGSAMGIFMIALLLQWTTQPQQRKDAVANAMRKARKPRFLNQAAARADVDAQGSDSEDEATSSDRHAPPSSTVMKLGPGMRFLDEDLEEEWEKESYPKNQQRGAVLLALVAFGLAVDRFYAFYELQSCTGDQWWMQKSLQIGCILVMVKVFAFLLMIPAAEGARSEAASAAARFFLPSKFWDSVYWILLGFFGCFFIVVNLWPFSPSCNILSVMARVCSYKSVRTAKTKLDCTLQGHTACQMIQLWMLIMPYALPQFRCFHLTFIWLGFFYVGVSWLYAEISGEKNHMVDLGLHFSMLVVTAILGTMKKYYLEKGMRRQFLEDNLQRKALEHLYVVFDGMVPKYVIPRMLMQKPICDYRQRVSILFVLIHDFHVSDANAALTFLNTYFGKMDDICAAHKVTKIETVAEEYVCSVGVVPEDLPQGDDVSAERQHQELLQRLFGAAYEIQRLQNEAQKKFKMGIHTGEIHAGVIGQKLPRFRLFGDTINTSARMMQKASPGQLLFGEATNRLLPSSLKVKEADGIIVKMKGKGDVKAFCYDETNFPKSSAPVKEPGPEKPKEMVVKAEVNKAIRLSDSELLRPQSLPFLLSEKVEFKSHDPVKKAKFSEEKFQMWFHLGFARKFRLRLHRQILLMALMTVMDVMHMEHTEAWDRPDIQDGLLPKHPTKRFVILLSCRAVILAMGLGWSLFARTDAFQERVQEVQWGLVVSTVIVATLMFISYDALIYPQILIKLTDMHYLDYVNQQQSLVFVLAYFIVTNTHPTLFYQSLVYIPLGVVFMYIRNRTSLYISDIGRVMFLCTVVISCLLAHVLEQTSRARFKTKQRVEETQDRVETVLSNLMPKKVLEEIKLSPGLGRSHSYDHATITQSDLCGFTQLASDKSPEQVVAFVEDLFGRFDRLTDEFQVYKVETVGDAYIAGMAEHTLTSENSPIQVVQFGMAMIKATAEWAEKLGVKVTCRVGVHHGHCVGGVVGKGMQRYHLFGSFMSELDTLEATSREGITQISRACKDAIVREHLQRLNDAAREATLTDVAALEKLQKEFEGAIERSDDKLTTSKGEEHDYSEVGGRTFLIYKDKASAVSSA